MYERAQHSFKLIVDFRYFTNLISNYCLKTTFVKAIDMVTKSNYTISKYEIRENQLLDEN